MLSENFQISDYQARVLSVPQEFDLFLGGGRGSGKSVTLALLAAQHLEQYGRDARVLYVRKSYAGLRDFELICYDIIGQGFPGARYNQAEHIWKLPSGAIFELGQIETEKDFQKYHGHSRTLILADEVGQYPELRLLDLLRSNLRAPKYVKVRTVFAANPGGVSHQNLAKRFVFKQTPWHPFTDEATGRQVVHCPATLLDNPGINHDEYTAQLKAACAGDPELFKAWLLGDWTVARGAYFAGVLDESRNAIDVWHALPGNEKVTRLTWRGVETRPINDWRYFLAHDYGCAAPSVTYLVAESGGTEGPDGRYYPRGSLLLIDELATHEPGNLNKGLGWTVPRLAEEIKRFAARWKVKAAGVADDAIFANTGSGAGSISEEFRKHGVYWKPARKGDRLTGWERMRRMLEAAGQPDVPGLYISRNCSYFWATAPYLSRDSRRIDDIDTNGADHGVDSCRYACLLERKHAHVVQLTRHI